MLPETTSISECKVKGQGYLIIKKTHMQVVFQLTKQTASKHDSRSPKKWTKIANSSLSTDILQVYIY